MKIVNFLKKPINVYMSIMVMLILALGLTSISFAYFIPISTNETEEAKVDNRMASDDLVDQTITLDALEERIIDIYVTSYNIFPSDFRLSYLADSNNIILERLDELGNDLEPFQSKKVTIKITNLEDRNVFIKFEIDSGLQGENINTFGTPVN